MKVCVGAYRLVESLETDTLLLVVYPGLDVSRELGWPGVLGVLGSMTPAWSTSTLRTSAVLIFVLPPHWHFCCGSCDKFDTVGRSLEVADSAGAIGSRCMTEILHNNLRPVVHWAAAV